MRNEIFSIVIKKNENIIFNEFSGGNFLLIFTMTSYQTSRRTVVGLDGTLRRISSQQPLKEGEQVLGGLDTREFDVAILKTMNGHKTPLRLEQFKERLTTAYYGVIIMRETCREQKKQKEKFKKAGADDEISWRINGHSYSNVNYMTELASKFMSLITYLELAFKDIVLKQPQSMYKHTSYEDAILHLGGMLDCIYVRNMSSVIYPLILYVECYKKQPLVLEDILDEFLK